MKKADDKIMNDSWVRKGEDYGKYSIACRDRF